MPVEQSELRDKGGRILPGKRWRVYNFIVEVAVESPKDVDNHEAADNAAEFMSGVARTMGRVDQSFCSITRIDEYGFQRPPGGSIVVKLEKPKGKQITPDLPIAPPSPVFNSRHSGVVAKPKKAKPKKAAKKIIKKTKSKARY